LRHTGDTDTQHIGYLPIAKAFGPQVQTLALLFRKLGDCDVQAPQMFFPEIHILRVESRVGLLQRHVFAFNWRIGYKTALSPLQVAGEIVCNPKDPAAQVIAFSTCFEMLEKAEEGFLNDVVYFLRRKAKTYQISIERRAQFVVQLNNVRPVLQAPVLFA